MTTTLGRVTLTTDPVGLAQNGDQLSFTIEVLETTLLDAQARRQQLSGLVNNIDEPTVPCTFTIDSQLDGYYTVKSLAFPFAQPFYTSPYYVDAVQVTLERVANYGAPLLEVTVQSVLRTNAHGFTVPPAVIAHAVGSSPTEEVDLRPSLTSGTSIARTTSAGSSTAFAVYTLATPVALTQYRTAMAPSLAYTGGCTIEWHDGTNYQVAVGRQIPLSRRWRISNGIIRLTSANGATSGTIEVWDNAAGAWESANVSHWTNGAVGPGIGYGNGTNQAAVTVLRNSPEQVTIRCAGGTTVDWTYTLQRGAMFCVASWTSGTATKYGGGYTTTNASSTLTGGIRRTSNDANGNRCVFSMPVAQTTDTTNGGTNASTAATSGTVMFGVELAGSSAISGNAAADLINQFHGAVSWRQQVVKR